MCQVIKKCGWNNRKPTMPEPLIMKKELVVYKVGKRIYTAVESVKFNMNRFPISRRKVSFASKWFLSIIYTDFMYRFGKVEKGKLDLYYQYGVGWTTSEGYYSYESESKVEEKVFDSNVGVGKFIIPKGSKYYYCKENGIYISNKIKFVGWVK